METHMAIYITFLGASVLKEIGVNTIQTMFSTQDSQYVFLNLAKRYQHHPPFKDQQSGVLSNSPHTGFLREMKLHV